MSQTQGHKSNDRRVESRGCDQEANNFHMQQRSAEAVRLELEFIINHSPAVVFLWRAAEGWPVEYVSENIRQFGYTAEDLYSGHLPFADLVHPGDLPRVAAEVEKYSQDPMCEQFRQEYRIRTSDARYIWVDDRTWIRRDEKGRITHYQGLILDITDRKKAEMRILQLNRLLRTITEINQLVVRAENKRQLFDGACRILLEHSGLPAVWIGEIEKSNARIFPVAWAGLEDDYMQSLDIRWDDSPEGQGPAGRAVRTGQHVIISDLREIPKGEAWRERLWQRGFLCAAAFPVKVNKEVMAVLNLGTREAGGLGAEEAGHLDELVADLGYALEVLDLRREQAEAMERLKIREAQLSNALMIAKAGHWEYDVEKDLFTFNDNFYRIFHTTAEQVGGYQMSSAEYARRFCHPDDAYVVAREVRAAIETKEPNYSRQLEHRILYADGGVGYAAVRFFIVKDASGRTVRTYGVNQDITEHKLIEEQMAEQLRELRQWYIVTLGREERVIELKREVDELLLRLGEKPRYGGTS